MSDKDRNSRGGQRGIALLSVIALLIIFLIFAGAVVTQMAQAVNSAKSSGVSNRALTAADAGVHGMVVAIEENIAKGQPDPVPTTYAYPEPGASPSTLSYTVKIEKAYVPLPLPGSGSRFYLITSTGTVNNGFEFQTRTVRAIVRAESIAGFDSFSNYEKNQFGVNVWYTPDQAFNGPVYSGGPMHVEYDDTNFLTPIFGVSVKTVAQPVWVDVQGGATPSPGNDWNSIVNNGQPNFATGVTPIGLPQPKSNILVASEALYGDCCTFNGSSYKATGGVYMNSGPAVSGGGALTTGMYIEGDAVIRASSAANQETFLINSPLRNTDPKWFAPYRITENFGATPTTTVEQPVGVLKATYSGVPSGDGGTGKSSGAIFVDGNAYLPLGSTIQGQYTLAVPDFKGYVRNIYITGSGSLLYSDKTKDILGLWANNVILQTKASNVEIDASIIAGFPGEPSDGGGFYNWYCKRNGCSGGDQGILTIFGGLAENMRGELGQYFSKTFHSGFSRHLNYDPRLAADPPPFNPVDGAYDIVAWEDIGS